MPDNLDYPTMGVLLRLLYQLYSLEIQEPLSAMQDLKTSTPPASNVFTFVTSQGATVSELANLSHVRKQTIAQAVEQLEQSWLHQRRPNPSDRRSQLVFLTPRGKQIPPITHKVARAIERRCGRASQQATRDSPCVASRIAHRSHPE